MKNLNKKYAVSSGVLIALVIIAVVVVNFLAASLTRKYNLKIDLTADKQYEITATTKEIMKNLDKDIRVMVMGTEEEIAGEINEYLHKYEAMSNKFKLEYVDVYKNQAVLNKYLAKGQSLAAGDIILECGERYKIINSSDIYVSTMSFEPDEENFIFELESKLTNGIVVVTGNMDETKTYFLEGHGEQSVDVLKTSLDLLQFPYATLNTLTEDIPEDAGLIVSVVPTADFSVEEIQKLEKFYDRGGNFLMIFSPGMPKLERVNSMLSSWGIVPNYDVVLEKDYDKAVQYENVMITDTNSHEITDSFRSQGIPVISINSSSFTQLSTNIYNAEIQSLLESSDKSIGKIDIESQNTEFEDGDLRGPLALAVVAERFTPTVSRCAVVGSAATLEYAGYNEGNNEFLTGLVSWVTNNRSTLVITPKIVTQAKVDIPVSTIKTMNYVLVWIIPVVILLAGIIIWIRRRYL